MAFSDTTKASYSFNKLFGKAYSDDTKEIGNEATANQVYVHSDNIFAETISSTPSTAVSAGMALVVSGRFVADPTSNNHTFFFQSGGQTITGAIPPSFGTGYELRLTDSTDSVIAVLDARNWVYDYANGVWFQQTANSSPAPASGALYIYIGSTATDRFGEGTGGAGGSTVYQHRWAANGPYQVDTDVDGAYISDSSFDITSIHMWRGVSGTAGSTVIDINKNGTTLYTTQSNRPSIAFNDADKKFDATLPDDVSIAAGDIITFDIDIKDVGNPRDLTITMEGK